MAFWQKKQADFEETDQLIRERPACALPTWRTSWKWPAQQFSGGCQAWRRPGTATGRMTTGGYGRLGKSNRNL